MKTKQKTKQKTKTKNKKQNKTKQKKISSQLFRNALWIHGLEEFGWDLLNIKESVDIKCAMYDQHVKN